MQPIFQRALIFSTMLLALPLAGAAIGKEQPAPARPKVRVGMSAAEVRRAVGAPLETKALALSDGAGECWVYRRTVTQDRHAVFANERAMAEADEGCLTQPPQLLPVYSLETTKVEQVTTLFVVNDRLVASKQWQERSVARERY